LERIQPVHCCGNQRHIFDKRGSKHRQSIGAMIAALHEPWTCASIGKKRSVAFPLLSIRNMLRRLGNSFSVEDISRELDVAETKTKSVTRELKRRGWLEPVTKDELSDWHRTKRVRFFQLTVAGNGFAMARAVKRIGRKDADERLNRFVERIKVINRNEDYGWYVEEAQLFGSFLDETVADLGDIDIALTLRWRPIIGRERVAYSELRALTSGKVIKSYLLRLTYAEREVRPFLKNRDPYISIHELSEIEEIGSKSRVLYRAPKKDAKYRTARPCN
jgi:hypothetical protein